MTTVYVAVSGRLTPLDAWDWSKFQHSVLVSFHYRNTVKHVKARVHEGKWRPANLLLDSGAYSAYNAGATIDIDALCAETKDPIYSESVGLDVIGSHEGSKKNAKYMKERGSPAMPVFHIGDPWELLDYYCQGWEKVGLSCLFGEKAKESLKFYDQCFARVWPHKFHSFGWTKRDMLLRYPFHSADSSSWASAARAYRMIPIRRRGKMALTKVPGLPSKLCEGHINTALELIAQDTNLLRDKWAKEMQLLENKRGNQVPRQAVI